MHIVTLFGNNQSGKTSLCSQWKGSPVTSSYVTTIEVVQYEFEGIIVNDTPSCARFPFDLERLCLKTDLFVLVVNEDNEDQHLYEQLSIDWPRRQWLLLLNGPGPFLNMRLWALSNDIRVYQLDVKTGHGVLDALTNIREALEVIVPRSNSLDLTADPRLLAPRLIPFLGVLYSSCV